MFRFIRFIFRSLKAILRMGSIGTPCNVPVETTLPNKIVTKKKCTSTAKKKIAKRATMRSKKKKLKLKGK